jgi:adenylate kinase
VAPIVPPEHVVIFGRPGSGKSSLAEGLGRDFGYTLVRTGEMLRDAVRKGGLLGQRVEKHLARGDLVPDTLIFELLEADFKGPGMTHLLFDGFPRTIGQVPLLDQFERHYDFRIGCYLEVDVSHAEAVARMTGRRVCPTCGATYHLISRAPRVADRCDRDGTRLERRPDDTAEVVEFRQKVYDDNATPILDHYRRVAPELCRRVDGNRPFDAVYAAARRALGAAEAVSA